MRSHLVWGSRSGRCLSTLALALLLHSCGGKSPTGPSNGPSAPTLVSPQDDAVAAGRPSLTVGNPAASGPGRAPTTSRSRRARRRSTGPLTGCLRPPAAWPKGPVAAPASRSPQRPRRAGDTTGGRGPTRGHDRAVVEHVQVQDRIRRQCRAGHSDDHGQQPRRIEGGDRRDRRRAGRGDQPGQPRVSGRPRRHRHRHRGRRPLAPAGRHRPDAVRSEPHRHRALHRGAAGGVDDAREPHHREGDRPRQRFIARNH